MLVKVNNLFEKLFGFRLVRTPKTQVSKKPASLFEMNGRPLTVDFIGASGIGKTTMLNALMAKRNDDFKFLTFPEFQRHFAEKPFNEITLPDSFSQLLLLKYRAVHEGDYRIENKIKLHHFFYNTLRKVWFSLSANGGATIVYDESLFHNFADVLPALERENSTFFKEILAGRIFINFTAHTDIILNRLSRRMENEGIIRSHHHHKSMEEITNAQTEYLLHQEELLKLLNRYHAPVLDIAADADFNFNVGEVERFILTFQISAHGV